MSWMNYILILLISIGIGLFVGWVTGVQIFGLLSVVVISVLGFLKKYIEKKIDLEAEQEKENRKTHTSDLKAMVQSWQGLLPEIPPTEETRNGGRFDGFDISFIKNIEDLPFFEDKDIFYHCQSLESIWNDLKKSSNDYSSKKQALFDSIKEDAKQKLENQNIDIKSIESGFYVSVYREVIIKDKKKNYDYFWDRVSTNGIMLTHLKYCEKAVRDSFSKYDSNSFSTGTCHDLASTKEPETTQNIHEVLIKKCKERYIKESDKLIKEEGKLRESRDNLYHSLEIIYRKPFQHMDCEFVRGDK